MTDQEILDRAWNVVSTVRDAAPRLPNDADTGAIVDALNVAGLLTATAAPADDEPAVTRMAVALRDFFQSDPITRQEAARAALAAMRRDQP